jgi:thioredoxin reductase
VPDDKAARLAATGVRVETRPIARLVGTDRQLAAVELVDGTRVPTEILFARPPQRHLPVVERLELTLDAAGFVKLDDLRQTSIPGIFAGGDLVTPQQGAILAAASAMQAAAVVNHGLVGELAAANAL